MRMALGILLTVGMTQIVGCAFGSRYVELPYPPENQVNMSSPATQPTDSGPRTHHVILAVNDARESRDRIGNVRNTFGMDTASVLTEDNIAVWVHDAIAFELDRLPGIGPPRCLVQWVCGQVDCQSAESVLRHLRCLRR